MESASVELSIVGANGFEGYNTYVQVTIENQTFCTPVFTKEGFYPLWTSKFHVPALGSITFKYYRRGWFGSSVLGKVESSMSKLLRKTKKNRGPVWIDLNPKGQLKVAVSCNRMENRNEEFSTSLSEMTRILENLIARLTLQAQSEASTAARREEILNESIVQDVQRRAVNHSKENLMSVMGRVSTGKSTISNALLGSHMCEIGIGSVTVGAERIDDVHGIGLIDVQGIDDEYNHTSPQVLSTLLKSKVVVIMIDGSVSEVLKLAKVAIAARCKVILVHSKLDQLFLESNSNGMQSIIQGDRANIESMIGKDYYGGAIGYHYVAAKSITQMQQGTRCDEELLMRWICFVTDILSMGDVPRNRIEDTKASLIALNAGL